MESQETNVWMLALSRQHVDPTISKPFHHRPLKSCRAQYIKTLTKILWKKEWMENIKTVRQLRRILITDEAKRETKLNKIANRHISAKLVQYVQEIVP